MIRLQRLHEGADVRGPATMAFGHLTSEAYEPRFERRRRPVEERRRSR